MLIDELIPGINLETMNTEFKGIIEEGKTKNDAKKEINWLKTIVAFANSEGGDIYIGVEDKSHKVVALTHEKADKVVLLVHRMIREKITPIIKYAITSYVVPNTSPTRYVLAVHVEKNSNLPVALHEDGLLGIYVRDFGQTRIASTEEIRDLVLLSENVPYDKPFTDVAYQKSDFSMLYEMANNAGVTVTEKELISIGFMSADKKLSEGALLFSDMYQGERTRMVVTKWPGMDKGSAIVEADEMYKGNLLNTVHRAVSFIKNHSVNGYKKVEDGREEYSSYPSRSVLEGLINAVGHRNYFLSGSQIEVNLFKDRLEILSPGSLLGVRELKKEKDISAIIPRRRNEVICGILSMLKLMENKGSGFDTIENEYSIYGETYRPYVSSDSNSFTLCLPDVTFKGGPIDGQTEEMPVHVDGILTGKNDQMILSFCYSQKREVKEIAAKLGIVPSTYFRNNVLKRLVDEGYLLSFKEGKSVTYIANKRKVHV